MRPNSDDANQQDLTSASRFKSSDGFKDSDQEIMVKENSAYELD